MLLVGIATLIVFSCKNEKVQPKASNALSSTLSSNSLSGTPTAPPPYVGISFSADPQAGSPYTVTAYLQTTVLCGSFYIDQAQYKAASPIGSPTTYSAGDPAPAEAVTSGLADWVHITGAQGNIPLATTTTLPPSAYVLTYTTPDPTKVVAGTVGYRTHYEAGGGNCGASRNGGFNGIPSIGADVVIGDNITTCTSGLYPSLISLTPDMDNFTDKKGTDYDVTVQFNINTCGQTVVGKLQGGLIANTTFISATPPQTSISATAKSNVITWLNATNGAYVVLYKAHLLLSSVPVPITGEWSFKYDPKLYGGTGIYGYTDRITATIDQVTP